MNFAKRFIVKPGEKVRLTGRKAGFTGGFKNRRDAEAPLAENLERLCDLQYRLYAEGKRSLLVVLQAMDAGGKDGTIRHVMGPLNPQGCHVTSFKSPTDEELDHDFLWRVHKVVPRRGMIGIFNRSHYEDVLIVRVHKMVPKSVWSRRYAQIKAFESLLTAANVRILKFFLHISKDEQLKRLKKRIDDPAKHWKINPQDFEERKLWDDYVGAYEDALSKCSTREAPWFVIPADKKWFRNLAVSQIIVETLEGLDMKFPKAECDISQLEVE